MKMKAMPIGSFAYRGTCLCYAAGHSDANRAALVPYFRASKDLQWAGIRTASDNSTEHLEN